MLATSSHKGTLISQTDLRGPVALIVGNEGAGLPREILALADEIVAIPQSSRVESLNAGIAASVILYEAARQRQGKTCNVRGIRQTIFTTEDTERTDWNQIRHRIPSRNILEDEMISNPTSSLLNRRSRRLTDEAH